jgi:hypothetical protein
MFLIAFMRTNAAGGHMDQKFAGKLSRECHVRSSLLDGGNLQ